MIEVPDVDEPNEVLSPEELVDNDDCADVSDTPFVRSDTSGSTFSVSEGVGIAKQTGLLAQADVLNSMLATGMDIQRFDKLDWDHFDNSMAATNNTYGLDMIGGGHVVGAFTGLLKRLELIVVLAIMREERFVRLILIWVPQIINLLFFPPRCIDATASLEKRVIQGVVRQYSNELKACYEREVTKVKGLKGRLDVMWIIAVNGSVAKVYLNASTLKNKNV